MLGKPPFMSSVPPRLWTKFASKFTPGGLTYTVIYGKSSGCGICTRLIRTTVAASNQMTTASPVLQYGTALYGTRVRFMCRTRMGVMPQINV